MFFLIRKGETMRDKIKNWNTAVVIILAAVIAAGFLIVMDVAAFFSSCFVVLPGYGMTVVSELTASVYILILLLIFGYIGILGKTGEGFLTGFYIGGFMTAYCIYEIIAQFYIQRMSQEGWVQSFGFVFLFVLAMFLIGFNEELVFRGIILNLFLDKFGNSKKGIVTATVLSSVIFGAVHLTNIFSGVSVGSAVVQAIQAAILGGLLAAIYLRSGNIWIVIIVHALTDFASMLSSGIYGMGNAVDSINQLSWLNFVTVPIFLIPTLVLFRKDKLKALEHKRNGIVVIPSEKECEHTVTVSLILGLIGIFMSCAGYGIAFSTVGLLGAYTAWKESRKKSGLLTAAFCVAVAGMVISLIACVFMLGVVPQMADLSDVMRGFQ